jgi:hypothetical protein
MRKLLATSLAITVATFSIGAFAAEFQIPRTMVDKGTYYLLVAETRGSVTTALHKRVGVNETGYSKTEISCKTMQYRDMGYSEVGPDKIAGTPGKWTDALSGSSKSDLVNFVCSRKS